jgi:hypothetical protein
MQLVFIYCPLSILIVIQIWCEKLSCSHFSEKGDEPLSMRPHVGPEENRVRNHCFKVQWLVRVTPVITIETSVVCPFSVIICFI